MVRKEKSCGAVVYYQDQEKPVYLLIQHLNGGHWSFAKGHVENNETEVETALREISEETNLIEVNIDTDYRKVVTYSPAEGVIKDVVYFVGEVDKATSGDVERQAIELTDHIWLPFDQAMEKLNYESDQEVLSQAHNYILENRIL